MTASTNYVWSSRVQFQPYPGAPDPECIDLGFLVELATKNFWAVGCAIRSSLDPSRVSALDHLTREILEKREDVIRNEFVKVLSKAEKPGQVLQLLAANNQWSVSVGVPEARQELARLLREKSAEKVFELVIQSIVLGTDKTAPKPAKKKVTARKKGTTTCQAPTSGQSNPPQFYRFPSPHIAPLGVG